MADPTRTTFIEPAYSRSIVEWTPSLIRAARAQADIGHLELAADFCEWAMGDDRVSAALSTRTNGLVALPLDFEAARGTRRLVRALEAGEDWWASYAAEQLSQLLAWGRLLGVGIAQQVWTDRGASINRIIPVLKAWHPRNLRWDNGKRGWQVRVEGPKWIDVEAGDGSWVIYTPYGTNRPWTFGAWRAISYWRLLKQYAIEDWGYYSSKNAGGKTVATQNGEAKTLSKAERKELAEDLFEAQANASMVLPPGFDIKVVEATANTWETYRAQKDAADMGIAVALLGQNLSTEVSGPTSTGATLHGRVLQVFIDADAETLSTCIREQSLTWWAEFNFGNRDLAPWPVWDTKPPEDAKARAEVDKTRSETAKGLAAVGVFTVDEVRVAAGLEPLGSDKGGDELVKPAAPAAPAAAKPVEDEPPPADDEGADDAEDGDAADAAKQFQVRDSDTRGVVRDWRGNVVGHTVPMKSSARVRADSGVVQGQIYADAVADHARARAVKVLDEGLVAVLEAIDAGESYDDIRKRLISTFKGLDPAALAKLTEAALVMAELGGRHAMQEDS